MLLETCRGGSGDATRPNVVLISIDCLNQRQFETALRGGAMPTLRSLARRSTVFTRGYAHAPWTTPSHMSMLSGLFPTEHGRDIPWRIMLRSNDYYDRVPRFPTLAATLRQEGYETVAFVGTGSISGIYGLRRGFDVYHEAPRDTEDSDLLGSFSAFRSWLRDRKDRPFFLFVHTYDFHEPRSAGLNDDNEALRRIDQYLGKVLSALRQTGGLDNALIFATGDHGSVLRTHKGQCAAHGVGHYEENLRVPFVMTLPRHETSSRTDRLARHVDILPTVLDVVGIREPGYRGVGVSLRRALQTGKYARFSFSSADARCLKGFGIVSHRYKYVFTPRGRDQTLLRDSALFMDHECPPACQELPSVEKLFDLDHDPGETRDLLATEPSAAVLAVAARARERLRSILNRPRQYDRRLAFGPERPGMRPEVESGLRALGYLE